MTPLDDLEAENQLLRSIIEVTTADLDMASLTRLVAASVTAATRSDVCFVHLVDEDRGGLMLVGGTPPFDELAGTIQLAMGQGVAGWVAQHAEPAVVPDKWKDNRYRYIPELRGEDFASMMSVPMIVRGGQVVGVLNVHARAARTFDEHDLALLLRVASMLARAVENANLYKRLEEREDALENFAVSTIDAQEMERRRLAGEIHDGISQPLISLWFHLLATEDAARGDVAVLGALSKAKDLAVVALDEARNAIAALRPTVLDDLGLAPGLESLAKSIPGVDVTADVSPCQLPTHIEVALYRIAQEALQNVMKHADASRISLVLRRAADGVHLLIADDGNGFSLQDARGVSDQSYGLAGMKERAELVGGSLSVESRPGRGTTVEVIIPGSG